MYPDRAITYLLEGESLNVLSGKDAGMSGSKVCPSRGLLLLVSSRRVTTTNAKRRETRLFEQQTVKYDAFHGCPG
jgi:hypothetical protein